MEVNTSNGQQVLKECGKTGLKLTCSVSSITLMQEPFNMKAGETLEVRVSAHTKNGWTDPSRVVKMDLSE